MGQELETSKRNFKVNDKLEATTKALESELKKLRVQTEQWRKAAEAAAAVLAGGVDQWISTAAASLNHLFMDMPVMWVKGKVVEEVTNSGWSKYL